MAAFLRRRLAHQLEMTQETARTSSVWGDSIAVTNFIKITAISKNQVKRRSAL